MKAAFTQASLALTVNTLPAVDRRRLCYLPPRRSDAEEDLYTDIFSQSQGAVADDPSLISHDVRNTGCLESPVSLAAESTGS